MIRSVLTSILALGVTAVLPSLHLAHAEANLASTDPAALRAAALKFLQPLPEKAPGAEKDSQALVNLGKELYFEKRLSKNNSQSCNSCHAVDNHKGGVDNEPTSPGAFGKRGGRNSPTTLNAGFQFAQFWDGRAPTLEDQAKGPVLNPIEMAMPAEDEVVKRLSADASYQKAFKAAFLGQPNPINYDNMARAIAAFERTLVTRDRFDDFLKGDDRALTELERKGLHNFLNMGCTTCHNGPVIGGNSYQKVGLLNPFPTTDKGRLDVTKDGDDLQKFKVPMLRNIALTGPYFHNGSIQSLDDAIEKMAWHQLGMKVTEEQKQSIAAFLQALTDKERAAKKRS